MALHIVSNLHKDLICVSLIADWANYYMSIWKELYFAFWLVGTIQNQGVFSLAVAALTKAFYIDKLFLGYVLPILITEANWTKENKIKCLML